ncbi:hypothetical protein [Polluticoccus soli]|uniref:hypothetical protein n=1 Tax=Polluticoccus soli TaxID=3034150 RepID=UPI0023E26D71|nr:hypothetical protein [Flavipsychrobacter sp. JY13-12]
MKEQEQMTDEIVAQLVTQTEKEKFVEYQDEVADLGPRVSDEVPADVHVKDLEDLMAKAAWKVQFETAPAWLRTYLITDFGIYLGKIINNINPFFRWYKGDGEQLPVLMHHDGSTFSPYATVQTFLEHPKRGFIDSAILKVLEGKAHPYSWMRIYETNKRELIERS